MLLLTLLLVTTTSAQETAPYPNGTSGLKAGTVPPPGHYWLMYNRLYEARRNIDLNGDTVTGPGGVGLGLDVNGYANVHRFIHVTEYKILGADFAWNAVLPLVGVDMGIGAYGVRDSAFRIADINVEPFVIEWHKPRYDFGYLYGFFAPTAERNDARPALPGKGYWTNYVGVAGTYYFDDDRTWSLSALSRYEMCGRRRDVDITPGDNFSFEWGLARNVEKVLDVGVSGYCSWQTKLDAGTGIDYVNTRDRVFGIGPEVQYFSTKYKFGYHLRYWWEFGARDRSQGTIATLTIVKPF
ncbi:MAG: transporter [Pirellulales bacterium]